MEDRRQSLVVRLRGFFPRRHRLFLAGCLVAGVFLLFVLASNRVVQPTRQPAPFAAEHGSLNGELLPPDSVRRMGGGTDTNMQFPLRTLRENYKAGQVDSASPFREPQIVYSAELSVATRSSPVHGPA
jgi:hypothetical protein